MDDRQGEVTRLLLAWSDGDEAALERLMPLVTDELRRIARRYMEKERRDHTLQPTALVHEVYLRLVDRRRVHWRNRAHFFGFAAQSMRRILVDHARVRQADKRNDGLKPLSLDEALGVADQQDLELIALDDGLKALAEFDLRQSRVIELHFFAGLNFREIGEILGISPATVKREWRAARLWLYRQMRP
ncbi:MAG: sigma-70 family RNA polymerase sigma factor [Acidobacteriota bacterium]